MDRRPEVRYRHKTAAATLAATALLITLPSLGDWCLFSPDCFQYLGIARHLLETGTFPPARLMTPPGYPLMLVPLLLLGDLPILALRLMLAGCWAMSAVMTYLLHREELGDRLAWAAGLLLATSPVFLQLSLMPLSEMPYIALLTPALVVISAWWRGRARAWWVVGAGGLLTCAALMVRSMGFVLVIAGLHALAVRRKDTSRQRAVCLGVFLLCSLGPAGLWSWRQSGFSEGGTYSQSWTQPRSVESTSNTGLSLQLERLARYGPMRLEALKEVVLPKQLAWRAFNPPFNTPTTWLIGGLFVLATVVRLFVHRSPVDLYVLGSLLLVSLWPFDEGVRLLAPVFPVLVAYPLWAAMFCWQKARRKGAARVGLAAVLICWFAIQCSGMTLVQSRLPEQRARAEKRMDDMKTIAAWHQSHVAPASPWLGVTEDGDNSKLILLGAAYLARSTLVTVDVRDGEIEIDLPSIGVAFVQQSLAELAATAWGCRPIDCIRGFSVFTKPVARDTASDAAASPPGDISR